jgi:hypothetical protein
MQVSVIVVLSLGPLYFGVVFLVGEWRLSPPTNHAYQVCQLWISTICGLIFVCTLLAVVLLHISSSFTVYTWNYIWWILHQEIHICWVKCYAAIWNKFSSFQISFMVYPCVALVYILYLIYFWFDIIGNMFVISGGTGNLLSLWWVLTMAAVPVIPSFLKGHSPANHGAFQEFNPCTWQGIVV